MIHSARTWAPRRGRSCGGPISVLQSYAGIDYGRICKGRPITLELSDSVFRGHGSIAEVAGLVRTFAQLGGQQLQLDALSASRLLGARAHPEEHGDLIDRVWGWSGYFCELAPEYQDHVISRHLYAEVWAGAGSGLSAVAHPCRATGSGIGCKPGHRQRPECSGCHWE